MIQRFIELGNGMGDLYELIELGERMPSRVDRMMALHTVTNDRTITSLVLVMKPAGQDKFQALYICREGIPNPNDQQTKRYDLFKQLAVTIEKEITELVVKPSTEFHEKDLYYQYLVGILRMNKYIPPLQ
ncbi:DUF7147 family protein [Thalassobacillus hwangdonensis]|uniref:Methylthioribose kinase n=1 Tax=Thalassobacillus hwangdonensis TaxID=546108 RepID=A0ABW3KY60_9BACI